MTYNIDFKEEATRNLVALAKNEPKAFLKAQALIEELREHPRTSFSPCLLRQSYFRRNRQTPSPSHRHSCGGFSCQYVYLRFHLESIDSNLFNLL